MAFKHQSVDFLSKNNTLFTGTIIVHNDSGWRVLSETGEFISAQLAASCFVAPQKGSEVMLGATQTGFYILVVLTQPSKTLKIEADRLQFVSKKLLFENQATSFKTKELRFEAQSILSFAKKMYAKVEQFLQKADAVYLESQYHKVKTEALLEQVTHLRYCEAGTISEKADVISTQADKVLIN